MNRLNEMITVFKDAVEGQLAEFQSDDDISPALIFITAAGTRGIGILPNIDSDKTRDKTMENMGVILREQDAAAAAFLAPTWSVNIDATNPAAVAAALAGGEQMQTHPDRRETLSIYAADRELDYVVAVVGEIVREEGKPPRISGWTEHKTYVDGGQVAHTLRYGVKAEEKNEVMH